MRSLKRFARRFRVATIGIIFILLMGCGAIAAPIVTPYSPTIPRIKDRFLRPNPQNILGTDDLGRDILTRILYGGRSTLASGLLSVIVAMLVGSLIGLLAGYLGGWIDNALMRVMDIMLSFPAVLLAILIVASLRPGLFNLVVAIAFSMVPSFARLVRSVVLGLSHQEYVTAAHALGSSSLNVITRHLVPNTIPLIFVQATASLALAISTGAALNYLGLGVEPPLPDWGLMVSEGQKHVFTAAYIPFIPGLFITITVLSANFVGDAVRDYFDPVLRK